jgi:S1-C subfamily serine protease
VLVISVEKDSPADHAGVLQGDLIFSYDERPVASVDDLHRLLTEETIGREATLGLIRGTDKLELRISPAPAR